MSQQDSQQVGVGGKDPIYRFFNEITRFCECIQDVPERSEGTGSTFFVRVASFELKTSMPALKCGQEFGGK
jgi:hypothetical protein